MSLALATVTDIDSLPEYPIDPDLRLDSHGWMAWEVGRWLSSEMRWEADHECKSIFFELVNLSHTQTPVGTLPRDLARLARMVEPQVDLRRFEMLCALDFGPLHGWRPCLCDGQVRLMHDTVTRVVLEALTHRANHVAQVEAASRSKKLQRLTGDVMQLQPMLANDPRCVRWISDHIDSQVEARGGARRKPEELHHAVQACLAEVTAGRIKLIERKAG